MTEMRGETEMYWDKEVKIDKTENAVRIREGDKNDKADTRQQ